MAAMHCWQQRRAQRACNASTTCLSPCLPHANQPPAAASLVAWWAVPAASACLQTHGASQWQRGCEGGPQGGTQGQVAEPLALPSFRCISCRPQAIGPCPIGRKLRTASLLSRARSQSLPFQTAITCHLSPLAAMPMHLAVIRLYMGVLYL
jgi:hypothetical protein